MRRVRRRRRVALLRAGAPRPKGGGVQVQVQVAPGARATAVCGRGEGWFRERAGTSRGYCSCGGGRIAVVGDGVEGRGESNGRGLRGRASSRLGAWIE